jgi:hypothetical protein
MWLSLRIADTGESVVTSFPTNEQIRIRETAEIIGQLVPFQPPGTEVTVSVKLPNTNNWINYTAQTDDTGWYEFSYLPEGGLGEYKVKAAWAGTYYLPACESEEAIFAVGKGKSALQCSTDTQKVEPGTTVAIKTQLQPPLPGAVFNLEVWKPGQEAPVKVTGLTTQADGARTFYYELDKNLPGEWKFKASWAGNESYTGAISIPLVLYPGVDVGEALIVAGGGIENNTLWPTIENLANRFYMVLRSRRFNHDQIYYISPRVYSYDLNGDGKFEIVIDDHPPSKEKIQNHLLSLYREGVQAKVSEYRPLIIYLVDHGGTEKFKLNIGGEYLLAQELDGWLDALQAATNCEVVVIVEACHSGTFIEPLAPTGAQKRILISSSNTEVSNYDQVGIQSFTQYFLNQVAQGDNLKSCYHKTRDKLSNLRLFEDQDPQLNDGQQGARASNFYIGGTFLTGDIMPEITAVTPNQVIQAGPFPLSVSVADAEGIAKVWVSVMPPNFIIPQPTNEFETPIVSLEKIDLADPNGDDIYNGNYNFQYNGMYVLTFFVQDIGDNVVSQEVRLTVENGQATFVPGDLNNDRNVDLLDAIVGLQVSVGMKPSVVSKEADVNGDGKIGLQDVLYILQKAAGLR